MVIPELQQVILDSSLKFILSSRAHYIRSFAVKKTIDFCFTLGFYQKLRIRKR